MIFIAKLIIAGCACCIIYGLGMLFKDITTR